MFDGGVILELELRDSVGRVDGAALLGTWPESCCFVDVLLLLISVMSLCVLVLVGAASDSSATSGDWIVAKAVITDGPPSASDEVSVPTDGIPVTTPRELVRVR